MRLEMGDTGGCRRKHMLLAAFQPTGPRECQLLGPVLCPPCPALRCPTLPAPPRPAPPAIARTILRRAALGPGSSRSAGAAVLRFLQQLPAASSSFQQPPAASLHCSSPEVSRADKRPLFDSSTNYVRRAFIS